MNSIDTIKEKKESRVVVNEFLKIKNNELDMKI